MHRLDYQQTIMETLIITIGFAVFLLASALFGYISGAVATALGQYLANRNK